MGDLLRAPIEPETHATCADCAMCKPADSPADPDAQFLITGVMGPNSNAHGPNEFIHLPTGSRVTACVAQVLADHAAQRGR